jgi:hypothetical protein
MSAMRHTSTLEAWLSRGAIRSHGQSQMQYQLPDHDLDRITNQLRDNYSTIQLKSHACRVSPMCLLRVLSRFLEWRCGCALAAHGLRAYTQHGTLGTPYRTVSNSCVLSSGAPATCGLVGCVASNTVPRSLASRPCDVRSCHVHALP